MFFTRCRVFLPLGLIALGGIVPSGQAQRMGRYTLDPKTYKSPSGEYELRVDPSTIYGQGEGSYRLTRRGAEVWARKLEFTLWDAALTDDGTVAGYAYSGGMENAVPRGQEGKLHLVILDAKGGLRMNDVLPRRGSFSCTSTVDRNVEGFILDVENDRFVVRTRENGWSSRGEAWRTYRLSTGKPLDDFQFAHPQATEHESWFLLAAKPVAGTPLILVNWEYTKWDEDGNRQLASGGCFNLIDAGGKSIWELDLPNDYPQDFIYESRQTGMGAVLRTDQGRRFDVRFVKDNQRVSFQVTPAQPDGWQVAETARAAYGTPPTAEATKKPDRLEPVTLRHLGTVELQIDSAPPPEIRDIGYFDVDGRGRIGFLRREGDRSSSFLLIEPDGNVVWKLGLRDLFGGDGNLATATWLGGERWLLISWVLNGSGENAKWSTRAWWLDADTQKATAIEPFDAEGARHVAADHNGGFVVVINAPGAGSDSEPVIAFDREGKQRWRFDRAPEETLAWGRSSVAVMPDGKVVVSREYGSALTILSAEGKFLKTFDCKDYFREETDGKWLTPESDGTLLLPSGYQTGRVCRVQLDGTVKQKLTIKHRDGRAVELAGFPDEIGVRVDQQGTMWACDKHALLRLNADGIVEQVLGEPPGAPTLRSIGGAKIDQVGNVYLAEERNLITHVFDATGRRVRLLQPNPGDFDRSGSCAVDVAADGRVFVDGLGFSPSGERLGFRKLPGDNKEPDVFDGRVRYQPHANRYWIVGREDATLVGEDDSVVTTLKRRPNGDWLDQIEGSTVAPDGALVLAAGRMGMLRKDPVTLNLYSASGEPLKTVALPDLGQESGGLSLGLAYNGRYVIAGPFGYDKARYILLDAGVEPPQWYDLGTLVPYEDRWIGYWFVKDGKELWMYAEEARKVERFALPADTELPPSSAPTRQQEPSDGEAVAIAAEARGETPKTTASVMVLPAAPLNRLEGVIVSKTDGKPLADVPVVMVHAQKGYLSVGWAGIDGSGEEQLDPKSFASRNSKVVCDAVTGPDGTFVLRSFCAPAESWILAAGDHEHGICLRMNVVPGEFSEKPLRVEIDPPAFISTKHLPDPPDASFRASVELAITDLHNGTATKPTGDVDSDEPDSHVRVYAWPEKLDDPVWRLGPLPPGYTYRVTHSLWSPKLRYDITLFQRRVLLQPGRTELVSLEPELGMTIKGRLTDTKDQPLTDVNVLVRTQGDAGVVQGTLSDADGRYVLKNVPVGTHILELLRHAKPTAPI